MTTNSNPYIDIIEAVTAAGFFVGGPQYYDDPTCCWHRIIPASKRRPEGGYTGNSFWISLDDGEWFIGTWGGLLYSIENPERIAEMSIEWMSTKPDGTYPDFDPWLIDKYGLRDVSSNEFRPSRLAEQARD